MYLRFEHMYIHLRKYRIFIFYKNNSDISNNNATKLTPEIQKGIYVKVLKEGQIPQSCMGIDLSYFSGHPVQLICLYFITLSKLILQKRTAHIWLIYWRKMTDEKTTCNPASFIESLVWLHFLISCTDILNIKLRRIGAYLQNNIVLLLLQQRWNKKDSFRLAYWGGSLWDFIFKRYLED